MGFTDFQDYIIFNADFKLSECRSHLGEYAANLGERGERGERGFSCLGMPKS